MNWITRLMGTPSPASPGAGSVAGSVAGHGPATVTAPKPSGSPTSPENSPLRPAFAPDEVKQKAQVAKAERESRFLGDNFKASLMEVGVANVKAEPRFYGYGTHKPMTMALRTALPDDRLDLRVCLNVSGHDFKDADGKPLPDAKQRLEARAKDNRYVVQVTHADGRVEKMTGIEARGALSTAQDISIRGMKPGKTILEAWPEGSAGVGGYVEGRRLEITWTPPGAAVDQFG
jgi:hypothetical protein